jgi:hypothetical protein
MGKQYGSESGDFMIALASKVFVFVLFLGPLNFQQG